MRTADRAREQLVADLVRGGRVRSSRVRAALEEVPRHLFLPDVEPADAYADEAVPIKVAGGVTVSSVSQPSMVAIMLEQLDAGPGDRVLEIGAGAGWNAGLLAHVVGRTGVVTTVDIDDDLVEATRRNLAAAGIGAVVAVTADGSGGYPPGAPYDRIELTVGTGGVRPEWVAQLAPGGRLLLPLTVRGSQLSVALTRTGPGRLESDSVRSCAFVRLRGAGADPDTDTVLAGSGWTIQPAGRDAPTFPARVLDDPGADRPAACAGSVSDLWDGLGLWCALADPAVFRLLGPDGPGLAAAALPLAGGRAALGLAASDGCALLLADPAATVREFGPGGPRAADRLAALLTGWVRAGRPHSADLRLSAVVPELDDPNPAGPAPDDPAPDDPAPDDPAPAEPAADGPASVGPAPVAPERTAAAAAAAAAGGEPDTGALVDVAGTVLIPVWSPVPA
ncbi:protein-L-isoaspartate(D-aspartate) O-methyltransferase [Pseudonocardia nantongensis]|uniref:protein-L-isoaspartate(D-aspartate) O-methyltransferase n=1 Tax=Pseudonocardia nantongensis TaxID=1181885 RepID=UPI00397C627B